MCRPTRPQLFLLPHSVATHSRRLLLLRYRSNYGATWGSLSKTEFWGIPVVEHVLPSATMPLVGGVRVQLSGHQLDFGGIEELNGGAFPPPVRVSICGVPCIDVVQTPTTLSCTTTSGGTPGDVRASLNFWHLDRSREAVGGDAFTTTCLPPSITTFTPKRATTRGGAKLFLSGANFGGKVLSKAVESNPTLLRVTVGGKPCTAVRLRDDSLVDCDIPAGIGSGHPVVMQWTGGGGPLAFAEAFAYDEPQLRGVSPSHGMTGATIEVSGVEFGPVDAGGVVTASVGDNACTDIKRLSETKISCVVPPKSSARVGSNAGLAPLSLPHLSASRRSRPPRRPPELPSGPGCAHGPRGPMVVYPPCRDPAPPSDPSPGAPPPRCAPQATLQTGVTVCISGLCSTASGSGAGALFSYDARSCELGQEERDGRCLPCAKGSFSSVKGEACQPCPAGAYVATLGATECVLCPVNSYRAETGGDRREACAQCPDHAGTKKVEGATDKAQCSCVRGFFEDGAGTCTRCGPGEEFAAGLNACVPCAPGTFKEGAGQTTACQECPHHTYSATEGAVDAVTCLHCPHDSGTAAPGAASKDMCVCDDGYFKNAAGACTRCLKGEWFDADSTRCLPCAAGTYKETLGQSDCLPCPIDTYLEDEHATAPEQCLDCVSHMASLQRTRRPTSRPPPPPHSWPPRPPLTPALPQRPVSTPVFHPLIPPSVDPPLPPRTTLRALLLPNPFLPEMCGEAVAAPRRPSLARPTQPQAATTGPPRARSASAWLATTSRRLPTPPAYAARRTPRSAATPGSSCTRS